MCSYADTLTPVPRPDVARGRSRADFFEAPIGGFTCDEELYGFPQEFNIEYGATLVNTEIAAAADVDPTAGWATWDEFKADAKAMTETRDGTITRAGYHFTAGDGLAYTFFSLILQAGGQFLADDGQSFTIDTPEAREAVALMQVASSTRASSTRRCSTTQRTGSATATSRNYVRWDWWARG